MQRTRGLTIQNLAKLVISLLEEPYMKWGIDFVGPINLAGRYIGNTYFCNHILCYQVGGSKNVKN
jgi:hypothetical protein